MFDLLHHMKRCAFDFPYIYIYIVHAGRCPSPDLRRCFCSVRFRNCLSCNHFLPVTSAQYDAFWLLIACVRLEYISSFRNTSSVIHAGHPPSPLQYTAGQCASSVLLHLLLHSRTCSLKRWLPHSRSGSLPPSLFHSLTHSLSHQLILLHTHSLDDLLTLIL